MNPGVHAEAQRRRERRKEGEGTGADGFLCLLPSSAPLRLCVKSPPRGLNAYFH